MVKDPVIPSDAMENVYTTLDEKPYESDYFFVETTIDHPVEAVWPHALDIGAWMSDHRLETVSGEAGRVGHFERVFPEGMGSDVPLPHYHLYGIANVIPNKLIALEVFPERGGSYGKTREKTSFDVLLFSDLGDRTRLAFLLIDVYLSPASDQSEHPLMRDADGFKVAQERIARYFDNLRALVRSG